MEEKKFDENVNLEVEDLVDSEKSPEVEVNTTNETKGKIDASLNETTKNETDKKQTREENSYWAEQRRKWDAEKKELVEKNKNLEKEKNEVGYNTRKDLISKSVLEDLGLDSISNEDDLILCENYKKAVDKGEDEPIAAAYKSLYKEQKAKHVEALKTKENDEKVNRLIAEDQKQFKEKFGISTSEALKDENFKKLFGDLIEAGNFTKIYGIYKSVKPTDSQDIKVEAKKQGILPSSSSRQDTRKSYENMSKEERIAQLKREGML